MIFGIFVDLFGGFCWVLRNGLWLRPIGPISTLHLWYPSAGPLPAFRALTPAWQDAGGTKAAAAEAGAAGRGAGEGSPGEGDAQQGLIQLPLPKPPHLEASLQHCLSPPEVGGSNTALRHTAGELRRKGRESSRTAPGWGCQRHPRCSPNTPLVLAPCDGREQQ